MPQYTYFLLYFLFISCLLLLAPKYFTNVSHKTILSSPSLLQHPFSFYILILVFHLATLCLPALPALNHLIFTSVYVSYNSFAVTYF